MTTNTILLISLTLAVITSNVQSMAFEKRRFGQENPAEIQEISGLAQQCNDNTGVFPTIAGGFISQLLAATDPCGRYAAIDQVVTLAREKNCLEQGIAVARKMAALEKNFNPFAGANAKPAFCNNAALPASPEVRCIVPVIDPGFGNAQQFNVAANARLTQVQGNAAGNPGLCAGQSVQQQAIALGISDCVGCNAAGNNGAATPGTNTGTGSNGAGAGNNGSQGNGTPVVNNGAQPTGASPTQTATDGALLTAGTSTGTVTQPAGAATQTATEAALTPAPTTGTAPVNNGANTNIINANQFTGALLGAPPVVVSDLGVNTLRRFNVLKADGSLDGDFINRNGAIMRACVNQMNACAALVNANGGTLNGMNVANCTQQLSQCLQANGI